MAIIKEEKIIGEANRLKEFVIICGFGRVGRVLGEELENIKQNFIIIDIDEHAIEYAKSKNYLAIKGDATNSNLLDDVGITSGATSIVATTNTDAVNLSIILASRSLNPNINIIARANNRESKNKLKIAGANEVVLSNEITALIASEYIGQPVAFEAIDDILIESEGAIMDEVEILENSSFIGYPLKEIGISGFNLSLIGIIDANDRHDFKFNPNRNDYILQAKDILIVIGYKSAIAEFRVHSLSKRPKAKK